MERRIILVILATVVITSCNRMTKDDFLVRYERFIEKVQREHSTYTEKDWLMADKNLNKINSVLVNKFSSTLTSKDKISMAQYRIQYDYYRYSDTLKKGIAEYIDSDLVDDLDALIHNSKDFLSDTIKNLLDNTGE